MCIGLPGKITSLNGHWAVINMSGIIVNAVIDLIDKPQIGYFKSGATDWRLRDCSRRIRYSTLG